MWNTWISTPHCATPGVSGCYIPGYGIGDYAQFLAHINKGRGTRKGKRDYRGRRLQENARVTKKAIFTLRHCFICFPLLESPSLKNLSPNGSRISKLITAPSLPV